MSDTLSIWLFGVIGSWNIALTLIWWNVRDDIKDTKLAVDLFVSGMGKAAAMVIHRDDDRYGIDGILDRYRSNRQDLALEDWIKLEETMKKLQSDKDIPDGTKIALATVAFALLAEFAKHKIYGKNPIIKQAVKEALNRT